MPSLDFYKLSQITFEKPDTETFQGLALAFEAMEAGGSMPTVYNAANEKAVSLFLKHRISFLQIPELIGDCMSRHRVIAHPDLEQILETERWTYETIAGRGI